MPYSILDVIPKDCPDWDLIDYRIKRTYTGWAFVDVTFGVVVRKYIHYNNGKQHRVDGPAQIFIKSDGKIESMIYCFDDRVLAHVYAQESLIVQNFIIGQKNMPEEMRMFQMIRDVEKINVIEDF